MRNTHRILVEGTERKRSLCRPRSNWGVNIRIGLREI